jgi:hypothetical protein
MGELFLGARRSVGESDPELDAHSGLRIPVRYKPGLDQRKPQLLAIVMEAGDVSVLA